MAHPSLTKKQATLVNIIALGTIAALALVGILSSTSLEQSEADTPMQAAPSSTVGLIDTQRILAADEAPGDWLAYGRDYGEQRFSPLTQVNKKTIKDLELAWSFDMYTNRGLEASPRCGSREMPFLAPIRGQAARAPGGRPRRRREAGRQWDRAAPG